MDVGKDMIPFTDALVENASFLKNSPISGRHDKKLTQNEVNEVLINMI